MKFYGIKVKGVTSNIVKGEITISFTLPMELLPEAQDLSQYADGELGTVDLEVHPQQLPLKLTPEIKSKLEASRA